MSLVDYPLCMLVAMSCSQKDIFSVLSMSGCWHKGTTTCINIGQQDIQTIQDSQEFYQDSKSTFFSLTVMMYMH